MIDLSFEERLFESYIMKFAVALDDPQAETLMEDVMVEYRGEKFFVTDVWKTRSDDGSRILRVEAEAAWMRLSDRKRPGTTTFSNVNPRTGLDRILSGTGWSAGEVDLSNTLYHMDMTDATVLQLIWEWARITGNEVRWNITDKSVQMVPTIGVDLPVSFRYESNMLSLERRAQPPKFTRLWPYGRDSLTIASVNSGLNYVDNFTYYTSKGYTLAEAQANYTKEEIYVDDAITDAEILRDRAIALLNANAIGTVTYTMKVADLEDVWGSSLIDYKVGDTVGVYDELLSINERARIIRLVRWPHDPSKNEIELSFTPILVPDNSSTTTRADPNSNWEMFESRNTTSSRMVRFGDTILARLKLNTSEGAEWILGYSLLGVGVGSGTITIQPRDDNHGVNYWPEKTFAVSNGVPFQYNFTYAAKEIPAGDYTLVIRANSDSTVTGLDIDAGGSAMWVLAKSTNKLAVTLEDSIRFDYTGQIQYFTVPDDIDEIQIECAGAEGHGQYAAAPGGMGGVVIAKFPVVAGTVYSVWVGGTPATTGDSGWPNGGVGEWSSSPSPGGGGSSSVQGYVPYTTNATEVRNNFLSSLPSALIVAGGGGGGGDGFWQAPNGGGDAGFYAGGKNEDLYGTAATQYVGGTSLGPPYNGSFGLGGSASSIGPGLAAACGGGGGGWYGGYATGSIVGTPPEGQGGGGGSGYVHSSAFDLEYDDGSNFDHGYVMISWKNA